jgi:hypothetical protein
MDPVVVRGEVTGTPAGEPFGARRTGKSFRIGTIDIQANPRRSDRQNLSHGELVERPGAAARQVTQSGSL